MSENYVMPVVRDADAWRNAPDGSRHVIVGRLCHATTGAITLADDDGVFNIAVVPPMFSELDMFQNQKFMTGVRRAISVRASEDGWKVDLGDAFRDVPGHGCPGDPDNGFLIC